MKQAHQVTTQTAVLRKMFAFLNPGSAVAWIISIFYGYETEWMEKSVHRNNCLSSQDLPMMPNSEPS